MSLEQFAPIVDLPVDPGIIHAVLLLRSEGVKTSESCQGGEGHPCPEPFISFEGDLAEAWRAARIAREHGLPLLYVHHTRQVLPDGGLTEPYWQLVFCGSVRDWRPL